MEKVAGSVLFPCRYVSNGCNATMPHTDKSSHEDGCEFRSAFSFPVQFDVVASAFILTFMHLPICACKGGDVHSSHVVCLCICDHT